MTKNEFKHYLQGVDDALMVLSETEAEKIVDLVLDKADEIEVVNPM